MDTDPTNPAGEGDTAFATADDEQGVDTQVSNETEPQLDDDGNPIEEGPPESEEVELDADLKLTVPKDQAQKIREGWLRQADYTRKTQALAEASRAVEAERAAVQQASQAELTARAQMLSLDQQIAQYGNVDWDAWHDADPFEASKAEGRFQRLVHARQQAAAQVGQLQQQRALTAQQATAKALEEAQRALSDPKTGIKGWSPEYGAKLKDDVVRIYDLDPAFVDEITDHRVVRILDDAAQWRKHLAKQQAAQKHVQAQTSQPAATVGAKAAPAQGLDDRLGTEEWVRRRNAQLAKKAAA